MAVSQAWLSLSRRLLSGLATIFLDSERGSAISSDSGRGGRNYTETISDSLLWKTRTQLVGAQPVALPSDLSAVSARTIAQEDRQNWFRILAFWVLKREADILGKG